MNPDLLSIVIVVSDRHDDLAHLARTYRDGVSAWRGAVELVFVLDGAMPLALRALEATSIDGASLRVVQLPRAFGEATALTVGFERSGGATILTLPAYHQVDARELPKLLDALDGVDMAVARRHPRRDAAINRAQAAIFRAAVRFMTKTDFRDLGCGVRAMRRLVADEVRPYGDQHRFLALLARQRGFRVVEVDMAQSPQDRAVRLYRPGVYVRRLLDLLTVFFLVKFTRKPLRFFGLIGATLLCLGAVALTWVVAERLFFGIALADRPALLLSTLLVVLGAQILALGLIGELIIFTHAGDVAEYAVERIAEHGGSPEPPQRGP